MGDSSGGRWKFFGDIVVGLQQKPAYLLIFSICALVFIIGLATGIDAAVEKKPDQLYFAFGSFALGLLAAVIVIFRVEGAGTAVDPRPHLKKSAEVSGGSVHDLRNFPAFLPKIIEIIKNAPEGSGIQIACDRRTF